MTYEQQLWDSEERAVFGEDTDCDGELSYKCNKCDNVDCAYFPKDKDLK